MFSQYYGDLIKYLNKRDLKVLLVLIPHCNYDNTSIKNLLLNRLDHNINILDYDKTVLSKSNKYILILFNYYFNNDKYLKIIYVYTTYNIFIFQKGLYFSYSIYISLLFLGYYIMLFVLYLYKLYIYCITYIRSNEMHYYFKSNMHIYYAYAYGYGAHHILCK